MTDAPGSMPGPAPATLTGALAALADGRTTPEALTEQALERASAWQGHINAFIRLDAEAAREAARTPRAGPLAGVPMAHKDMFYRAGRVSTCGSALRRDWVAPVTATALQRLDAAGAIDLGTLNMSEWAGGATGHNIHFGDVRNPWNPAHVTGGSSSGSAAAVAAGIVFAALGSDTGGSIRVPAACCGIAGLKPTWGRVSRAGAMPRAWSLDCVGPLARTVEDVAAVMSVIAGPDPADPTAADVPVSDYPAAARAEARGMTVAVPEGWFYEDLAPPVAGALEAARRVFEGLGVRVVSVSLPDLATIFTLQAVVTMAEAAAIHAPMMQAHPGAYARGLFGRQQTGLAIPAATYLDALRLRGPMLRRFRAAAFAGVDALLVPALPVEVPTLAETDVEASGDYGAVHARMVRNTRAFNYLGLPALAVPCGFTPNGLPVAFQLAGPPFAEAALIRLGAAYQRATEWHRRRAPLPS
jgi:aspartyl-tRNA(Asn)/glutamyl-tRNA(Gln) amidotransferase subunit A